MAFDKALGDKTNKDRIPIDRMQIKDLIISAKGKPRQKKMEKISN